MYEYQRSIGGLGHVSNDTAAISGRGVAVSPALPPTFYGGITPARVNIVGRGVAISPALPPTYYDGIVPARVNIVGRGVAVSQPRHLSTVPAIDGCAMGRCGSYPMGTVDGTQSRPWWQYALLGFGISAGIYMVTKRARMMSNPGENMTPDEVVKQAAAISIQAGIPTILWGPPGIGKTQWIQGLGKAMAPMNGGEPVEVFTLIGSTKDPTDIGGMPMIDGSVKPPKWAAQILERSLKGKRSILFLDEFSSMSPMVHAALLRVVNEKVAGETNFDPKRAPLKGNAVHIIAAANRPRHGAAARDLPPPAANRMTHFNWPAPTAMEWAEGVLFGWKSPFYFQLPEDWREGPFMHQAREKVGSFLKFRESKASPILFLMPSLEAVDEEGNRQTGGAWPSPRSWEMAADVYAATMAAGAPKNIQIQAVTGAVGTGAAGELFTFTRFEDLPDPNDVLKDPENWDVPADTVKLFIISNAIVNAVKLKLTEDRYDAAWRAMSRAVDATDDVPTLTVAARELAGLKMDPRYKDVLAKYPPPKWAVKKFAPAFKKMKLI